MKIAMIGHKRIPSREGGIEIVVEELGARMVKLGHKVVAYNRRGHHVSGKKFDDDNKNSHAYRGIVLKSVPTINRAKLNAIIYSLLASIRALAGNYDVIHYHAEGPCSMIWLPHLFGIRTVATIHGLDWKRAKWGGFAVWFLKFGEKIAVKYADEIIVLSTGVQDYFRDTYGRRTWLIPNGVEAPDIREPEIIKEKYGLNKDSYILFLARIVPEKGLHYLIDAYQRIQTNKKLVIAGGSSHTDQYMKKIMEKTGTDGRIIMTGFVQGYELEELYSNAYIYVLPSDVEGMPLSLLEAMSYGNCCLVSDIGENLEVIGNYGVAFRQGSINDLKQELERLLIDQKTVELYKEKAGGYICSKYSWERTTEKTLKVYDILPSPGK